MDQVLEVDDGLSNSIFSLSSSNHILSCIYDLETLIKGEIINAFKKL